MYFGSELFVGSYDFSSVKEVCDLFTWLYICTEFTKDLNTLIPEHIQIILF